MLLGDPLVIAYMYIWICQVDFLEKKNGIFILQKFLLGSGAKPLYQIEICHHFWGKFATRIPQTANSQMI